MPTLHLSHSIHFSTQDKLPLSPAWKTPAASILSPMVHSPYGPTSAQNTLQLKPSVAPHSLWIKYKLYKLSDHRLSPNEDTHQIKRGPIIISPGQVETRALQGKPGCLDTLCTRLCIQGWDEDGAIRFNGAFTQDLTLHLYSPAGE